MEAQVAPTSRLQRLLGFLQHDPANLSLLADAAEAALDEGELGQATDLLARFEAITALPPRLLNLRGLAAMSQGDFAGAAATFEALAAHSDDPALRFNAAWAKAMLNDHEGAAALLDQRVTTTIPNAATLKVHALHHLGRMDEALESGARLAKLHPGDADLMGALATVAIDAEDLDLAKQYAAAAGPQHEGLAAAGMLMLNDGDPNSALEAFDRALEANPDNPRAAVGKGLALLAEQQTAEAAQWLDQGAQAFGTHLGTWVASGWAYFVQGDLASSRQRFEQALAIDDTFAEIHGGLAVLDIAEKDLESAKRRIEIARRLDRQCFGAALATSLLLTAEGNSAAAERVQDLALNTPVGNSGRSIAQVMAAFGVRKGKPPTR